MRLRTGNEKPIHLFPIHQRYSGTVIQRDTSHRICDVGTITTPLFGSRAPLNPIQ